MLVERSTIAPHGGILVDRRAPDEDRGELVREALGLPRIPHGPDDRLVAVRVAGGVTHVSSVDDFPTDVST